MVGNRLIAVRDFMFGRLPDPPRPEEGIASNVLADRLKCLVVLGLLSAEDNPTDRKKAIYAAGKDAQFRTRGWRAFGACDRQQAWSPFVSAR